MCVGLNIGGTIIACNMRKLEYNIRHSILSVWIPFIVFDSEWLRVFRSFVEHMFLYLYWTLH